MAGSQRKKLWILWRKWRMNDFTFTAQGFNDYLHWQMQDRKILKKVNSLLEDIKKNIDDSNRLIYDIDELQNIRIISCRGHYED